MMKPFPSLSTAHVLIIKEKHQREINIFPIINHDVIAMSASVDQLDSFCNKLLTCNHYKKSGHAKVKCYRLIGFSANFKFTKGYKDDHQSIFQSANVAFNSILSLNITNEQYQKLLQMFKNHSNNLSASTSHVNASMLHRAMNSQGNRFSFFYFCANVLKYVHLLHTHSSWIIDIGVTDHM